MAEKKGPTADIPEVNNVDEALEVKRQESLTATAEVPLGFENEEEGDMIIPRIKIINALSPECRDKSADEGDIINSLTLEKYNDRPFIPVFKFNNNIEWRDRADGGGIMCISRDGKMGETTDGERRLCTACRRCEFDNTKQGKEAMPKCTKYLNFFGFFEGERMPIILSFGKTNYTEGKKLYSLAKVSMQNMWNNTYKLTSKLMKKAGNEWYNISAVPNGQSSPEDREFAFGLYRLYSNTFTTMKFDVEDTVPAVDNSVDVEKAEF